MMKSKSIISIIALLIISLLAASCSDTETSLTKSDDNSAGVFSSTATESSEEAEHSEGAEIETDSKEKVVVDLVENYNELSDNDLEYVEDFVVSDKESEHYRTEFRLTAFSEALGKSYKVDDSTVDIISYDGMFTGVNVRIYAYKVSLDQCIDLIKFTSSTLGNELLEDELDEMLQYIMDKKYANGYYYGNLGLTLSGNDIDGYDLMIKTD